jgi:tetratricopeptide (TPR) repeat protein
MNSSRRGDATVKDALSPFAGDAKPSLKTYAIAASAWFVLAAPLLSMSYMHNHAHEILLGRLVETQSLPTRAEIDELESFSRTLIATNAASSRRLEQLYRILSRSRSGRETTRLAEALARRNPDSIEWRLRWSEGLMAAGLFRDAAAPLRQAMALADARSAEDREAVMTALERLEHLQQHAHVRPPVHNASLVRPIVPRTTWTSANVFSNVSDHTRRIATAIVNSIPKFDVEFVELATECYSGEWNLAYGRTEEARSAFRRALRLVERKENYEPLTHRLFARYFDACLASPSSAELLKDARQVVGLMHRNRTVDAATLVAAAGYFSIAGDNAETIALLDRAHLQTPGDARIAQRLALELEKVGEYTSAAEILKSLLTDLAPKP